jgi:hypothetical protein
MSKSILSVRLFLYGLILWVIPFITAIPLFQLIGNNRVFFKSVMGVILVITTSLLWNYYLKKVDALFFKHAWLASLIWIFMSVIPDLLAYIIGFKMQLFVYLSEIAISYLAIPAILLTSAWLIEKKKI